MEGLNPRSTFDSVLVVGTIAFAFLAASFGAANSDLWLHLATGRMIAAGNYSFGSDPFSFFSEGRYWANHSWLFDLALYASFNLGGGTALVALKATGVAILAAVMMRLGLKGGGPVWLVAASTLLGVLAMSPRLVLQPQCLSLLFFATILSLLVNGGRAVRWVPPLLALWVNLDAWFILGLLAVVPFARSSPRWLLPASLFACLLSPHHIHAFVFPPELSPSVWAGSLPNDPRFVGYFAHPWRLGSGLAAWAFPVLLGLSGLSFLLNRSAIRSWRLTVWLPLAALAAWQARLVPFFAVAAGPILALNLGECLGPNFRLRIGRRLTLLLAAALIVLAWPGWLQSFHGRERALAWNLVPDPSLVRAAQRVHELQSARVFNTHPDAAHYIAWFAPGTRTGIDSRLNLTGDRFGEASILASLGLPVGGAAPEKGPAMLEQFETRLILLSESDRTALAAMIQKVTERKNEYAILEVDGAAVLVGHGSPLPRMNADRLAFAPVLPAAPESGPAALLEPAEWWDLAAHRQAPRTWEGESAPVYLLLFEMQSGVERSPALPLLAIRSARTSLNAQPRGDDVWTALALAYGLQSRGTWEATAASEFTLLKYLRHVQAAGALQQAILANPDNLAAHERLVEVYGSSGFLDLALHHRREQLRLAKRASASIGYVGRIQESIDSLERAVFEAENRFRVQTDALAGSPFERARIARSLGLGNAALDALLKSHPDLYGMAGVRMLLDLFLQTGRLQDARTLLDHDELLKNPAVLDLYDLPGGVKSGREWRYRLPAYNWFDFCQNAAAGRYDRAEELLKRLRNQLQGVQSESLPQVRGVYLRSALSELGAPMWMNRAAVQGEREVWSANVAQTQFLASVRGDFHALSGLLHLERGAVREAEADFREALERYAENAGPMAVHPGRPLAVRYRELLRHP